LIRSSREPLSNFTDSNDQQEWKLALPKTTTEDGISMDLNPLPKNWSLVASSSFGHLQRWS
jgi:hypothetical protein